MARKPLSVGGSRYWGIKVPVEWDEWLRGLVKKEGWGLSATVRDMLKKGMRSYGWRDGETLVKGKD